MSGQLVLITGATGLLGFKVLVTALEAGYRARVALRDVNKAGKIQNAKSIQRHINKIEFVEVPIITAADAYIEAIRGVDFIIHCASPVFTDASSDWENVYYKPAQQGTLSVLNAAAKESSVKRIVMTSTCLVVEPKNGNARAGPYDLKEVPDEATRNALPDAGSAYTVSKILSHVAANDFVEQNKVSFDLIRVMPGLICGANEHYRSSAEMRNPLVLGSNQGIMRTALPIPQGGPRITHQVLLDDVAKAHVLSLKPEVAKNGDNFILAGNDGVGMPWEDFVPVIQRLFPDAVANGVLKPEVTDPNFIERYDVSGSEKALGFKYAGPEEMVKSVVGQYIKFVEAEA